MTKYLKMLLASVMLVALAMAPAANAQALNANTSVGINLNVSVTEFITITATPSTVSFNGSIGNVTGSSPITVNFNYALASTRTKLTVYAYFSQVTALIGQNTTHNIPSNQVLANWDGGAFTPCNANDVFSSFDCLGGGVVVASTASSSAIWPVGTGGGLINLQIALGSNTPIDQYAGTLNIAAQAI